MSSFVKAWQIPSLLNLITSTLIFSVWNFLVHTPLMQTPPRTCGNRYAVQKRRVLGFQHESSSLHFWNRDAERWSSQKNLIWGSPSCWITLSFPPPAGGIHSTAPLSVKAEEESNNCKVSCANPENSLRRQQNLNTPLRLSLIDTEMYCDLWFNFSFYTIFCISMLSACQLPPNFNLRLLIFSEYCVKMYVYS